MASNEIFNLQREIPGMGVQCEQTDDQRSDEQNSAGSNEQSWDKNKNNNEGEFQAKDDNAELEEKLSFCCNTEANLQKLNPGSIPEMEHLKEHLNKMGEICRSLRVKFNHSGRSILFVTPDKTPQTNNIMKQAKSLNLQFNLHTVEGNDDKQKMELVSEVSNEACDRGAHVVVWFRRADISTADPDDGHGEVLMLNTMKRNAHIVSLYIILGSETDPKDITPSNWEQHAKGLTITFINVNELAQNVGLKLREVQDEAKNAESASKDKQKELQKKFDERFKEFVKTSDNIKAKKNELATISAETLHDKLTKDGSLRKKHDKSRDSTLAKNAKVNQTWCVPEGKHLEKFVKKAVDLNNTGESQASSVNELEARVFVAQVMLGQTISKAQELAEGVYDGTIAKVKEELAGMFCLTPAELHDMIGTFLNKPRDEEEDNKENETYGFTERSHFVEMYVGVVTSIAMPVLCATVLPCLYTRTTIDGEKYKEAVEMSRKELYVAPPKSGGLCCGCF